MQGRYKSLDTKQGPQLLSMVQIKIIANTYFLQLVSFEMHPAVWALHEWFIYASRNLKVPA